MERLSSVHKRYLVHSFLVKVGLSITDLYGGFVLYEITHSIVAVLGIFSIAYVAGFLARLYGLVFLLPIQRRFGGIWIIAFSLAGIMAVDLLLFVFKSSLTSNFAVLSVLMSFWMAISGAYYLFANTIKFSAIGSHALPGSYSSYLEIGRALSTIAVSCLALWLNANNNLLLILVCAAVPLALSLIPLRGIPFLTDKTSYQTFSVSRMWSRLSKRAQVANFSYDAVNEFVNPIVPLYLILIYAGSTSVPVSITGTALIASTFLLYAGGILKDRENPVFIGVASILLILAFLLVPFVAHTYLIGLLLLLIGMCRGLIGTGFDAEIGQEVSESGNPLEAIAVLETMRSLGGVMVAVTLVIYLVAGTFPLVLFALGSLVVVPYALYAIRGAR